MPLRLAGSGGGTNPALKESRCLEFASVRHVIPDELDPLKGTVATGNDVA